MQYTHSASLQTVQYTHSAFLHCEIHTRSTGKYATRTPTTSVSTDMKPLPKVQSLECPITHSCRKGRQSNLPDPLRNFKLPQYRTFTQSFGDNFGAHKNLNGVTYIRFSDGSNILCYRYGLSTLIVNAFYCQPHSNITIGRVI